MPNLEGYIMRGTVGDEFSPWISLDRSARVLVTQNQVTLGAGGSAFPTVYFQGSVDGQNLIANEVNPTHDGPPVSLDTNGVAVLKSAWPFVRFKLPFVSNYTSDAYLAWKILQDQPV